jgi:hypothetical protein
MTQAEAEALLAAPKRFLTSEVIELPPGISTSRELEALELRERFLLDIWRGTIRLSKYRYQTRARISTILARLDVAGAPHTNPDGTSIGPTHLHLYREGFEDRWAFELDSSIFTEPSDIGKTFLDFCGFCKVTDIPTVQGELL